MALRDQVVDVFFTGPDQLPPPNLGGTGRITDLRNADMQHWDPANPSKPQWLGLKQRKGFRSVTQSGHNAYTGVTTSPSWVGPRLLTTTPEGAPMSIVRGKPRVYDGTDWADYPDTRVLTNKTTARPIYSAQSVAQAPDKAWLGGVTCRAWTEVTGGSNINDNVITSAVVGFRSDNGTWVRAPFVYQASGGAGSHTMARVTHDGTNFWVFAIDHNGGAPRFKITVYDLNGQQLATSTVINLEWTAYEPGYWDIQRRPATSTVLLVQPKGTNPDADNNVQFTALSYAAATITATSNTDATVHCNGPVAFATNFQDAFNYIITTNFDTGDTVRLWAYRIEFSTPNYIQTHEYNFGITIPVTPDTLIGYTVASTDATPAHKNIVVSFGVPAIASSYGAAYDPALRYIKSHQCTWADVVTFLRETHSVCHVSRPLVIEDDYYAWTYYQSGSGEQDPSVDGIEIQVGDYFIGSAEQDIVTSPNGRCTGSTQFFAGTSVYTTSADAAQNIQAGDTVVNTVVPPGLAAPAGTAALLWTFTNLSSGAFAVNSVLKIIGNTDNPLVNIGDWNILCMGGPGPSFEFYTSRTSNAGGITIPDITFTTSGTAQVDSRTFYSMDIGSIYIQPATLDFLPNGTLEVTGNSNPDNNGTKTIEYAVTDGIWIRTTIEASSSTGFTAEVTPAFPNRWTLPGNLFDDSYIGSLLRIDGTAFDTNNSDFPITAVPSGITLDTGDETTLSPDIFNNTTTGKIILGNGQTPFTFYLQGAAFDSSFIGAILSWNVPQHDVNAGLYKITQVIDATHVVTVPVSTVGPPVSEMITDPPSFIDVLKTATVYPQIQPQWFLTPLGDVTTTAQVGNLELGLAYADWRREAAVATIGAQNPYLLHVSSPVIDLDGYTVDLPFRAVTVTEQSATAISGNVSVSAIAAAVIGIKEIKTHSATFGQVNNNVIPGPMASVYDGGNFVEAGILIGLEQPTLESTQEADNPALKVNQTYQYQACLEAIDGTGNRIWTAPSPPLNVTLIGDDDSITISGRLPIPLGSSGINQASARHYGLSNRPMLVLSIYRTCIQNGLSTTDHYKITDDLAPNATAPISSSNDSGFEFPDEFTWLYTDENLDSVVLSAEKLYTDQGNIPRFHPPAFHNGATGWQERDWLNAYDGAIWFSGQKNEGEADYYTPLFRVPAPFEPTAVGNLEAFLAGFASDSKWYLPNFKPPLNNGTSFNIPSWQRLSLAGGCVGPVIPVRGGVAYASNFGGVWFLSRALQDEWVSKDYVDSLDGKTITALAVDAKQRLFVLTGTTDIFVYNQIARRWSRWPIGDAANIRLATVSNGTFYYQSNSYLAYYDPTLSRDIIGAVETGTPLGFTLAAMSFANVSGVKKLRQLQINGTWQGNHNIQAAITYPDQNPDAATTNMQLYTPSSTAPYVIDLYPKTEEADSYGLVVDADFTDVTTPGDSFTVDTIGALVAIDGRAGTNRSMQQISNASS